MLRCFTTRRYHWQDKSRVYFFQDDKNNTFVFHKRIFYSSNNILSELFMTVVQARPNLFGSKSCLVRRIEGKSVTLLEIYFQRYKSRKDLVIHPRADFGNKTSPNWKCSFRFNWGMFCVIKAWNKSSRYLMRFFSGLENLQIFCQRLEWQSIRLLTNDTLLAFFPMYLLWKVEPLVHQ